MASSSAASGAGAPAKDFTGWFTEEEVMWPGQRSSLKVESVIHREKSDFQEILVFRSASHGLVLALDGVIQFTEHDEAAYHEMITHVPMFAHHSGPERVLIIGGGDGGVLREVCRHGCVATITLCELDERVVAVAREHLGSVVGDPFSDSRLAIRYRDGAKFIKDHKNEFDVIIIDSSDPVGASSSLFTADFIADCKTALRRRGILCMQAENQWLHGEFIRNLVTETSKSFEVLDYAYTSVPTYPGGQIGFVVACKMTEADVGDVKRRNLWLRKPRRYQDPSLLGSLRVYNEATHEAAFALPSFARRNLKDLTFNNFILSADLPEGLPSTEEFYMFFAGCLAGGLVAGLVIGRFLLPRIF